MIYNCKKPAKSEKKKQKPSKSQKAQEETNETTHVTFRIKNRPLSRGANIKNKVVKPKGRDVNNTQFRISFLRALMNNLKKRARPKGMSYSVFTSGNNLAEYLVTLGREDAFKAIVRACARKVKGYYEVEVYFEPQE